MIGTEKTVRPRRLAFGSIVRMQHLLPKPPTGDAKNKYTYRTLSCCQLYKEDGGEDGEQIEIVVNSSRQKTRL